MNTISDWRRDRKGEMTRELLRSADRLARGGEEDFATLAFHTLGRLRERLGATAVYLAVTQGRGLSHNSRVAELLVGQHPTVEDAMILELLNDSQRVEALLAPPRPLPRDAAGGSHLPGAADARISVTPMTLVGVDIGLFCAVHADPIDRSAADDPEFRAALDVVGLAAGLHRSARLAKRLEDELQPLVWHHEVRVLLDKNFSIRLLDGIFDSEAVGDPSAVIGRSALDFVPQDARDEIRQWLASLGAIPTSRLVTIIGRHGLVDLEVRGFVSQVLNADGRLILAARKHSAPVRSPESPLAILTARELEVVDLIARGRRVTRIAQVLCLSEHTVRNHLKKVFRKLRVASQAELIDKLIDIGYAPLEQPPQNKAG